MKIIKGGPMSKEVMTDDKGRPLKFWGGKANEALDKKAENARELGLDYEPAQHTPVGLRDAVVVNLLREGINKHRARELADHFISLTSPPAQRKPLTDEEISEIAINNPPMVHEFARAIEAKLRSKNA